MRHLAVLALLAVVVAGCGGGGKKTTFTNANWSQLQFSNGTYDGAPVDFTGQVYFVADRELDGIWLMVYADVKRQNFKTLVKVPDTNFQVQENELVHVVGVVDQKAQLPSMVMWDSEPIVVASSATVVTQ